MGVTSQPFPRVLSHLPLAAQALGERHPQNTSALQKSNPLGHLTIPLTSCCPAPCHPKSTHTAPKDSWSITTCSWHRCGSVGWVSPHRVKGLQFHSQLGLTPRVQGQSPVGVCSRDNQLMFLSHIDFFVSMLSAPLSLSLKNK